MPGTSVPSGLRFPEDGDPPDGPLAFQNLTADIERVIKGSASVPVCESGWAWSGQTYGNGIEMRMGRVVTVDGLLKRTGTALTLPASPATTIPVMTIANVPDATRSFTGALYITGTGVFCRWYIAGGSNLLQILHPGPTTTAVTIATNSNIAMSCRWVMAP